MSSTRYQWKGKNCALATTPPKPTKHAILPRYVTDVRGRCRKRFGSKAVAAVCEADLPLSAVLPATQPGLAFVKQRLIVLKPQAGVPDPAQREASFAFEERAFLLWRGVAYSKALNDHDGTPLVEEKTYEVTT